MANSKHVVITGAGTGIGSAIAQHLDQAGLRLTLIGRSRETLQATAKALKGQACVATADIADRAAINQAVAEGVKAHGPLFGLVANAGLGGPNEAGDDDRFDAIVDTNLRGTYLTMRAAEPHLQGTAEQPARVIAIASILARIGVPGYTAYCASKAGVLGLVRAMAMELVYKHIVVNAVCPGWVNTQMARDGIEGMAAGMGVSVDKAHSIAMGDVPIGRMGEPAEIAGLVAFLLGDAGGASTGAAFDFNGGAWLG